MIEQYKILYKLDINGYNRAWYAEQEGNKFRTISGAETGKFVTSEWTECLGKNISRSNETTPEQQAESEIDSLYNKKRKEGYAVEDEEAVINIEPMLAKDYKKRLAN